MDARWTVAVLGAGGMMGFAMARNLARAGFAVRAWNRTRAKAEPLADDGAVVCDSPAEAAEGADALLTMLADGDAVIDAVDGPRGAFSRIGDDVLWLQTSTIGEAATERCAELARRAGTGFVDAPVLGTKQPAEAGELIVLASGADELRERAQPLFDVLGKKTLWLGEAGAGTRLKLVANSWIVAVVEGGAETLALAEGLGVDPADFFAAIEGGTLDLPYLRMKGRAMVERDFTPSFSLALAAKDARLVEEAAARRGMELPAIEAIRRRLEQGVPEHGDEDLS
ncbi:MAG TPA: NAD(P)-dependent oxidoreductase, partial [Conexibacter sp.]|nr:NAD(P)-dependent oxidoreductase [Conexibacter sp.]